MKKREGFKIIISPKCQKRIENNQCPACGKPKSEWVRRKDWRCCSNECSKKFYANYYSFGWPELRLKVFKRDKFRCAKCGVQSTEVRTWEEYKGFYGEDFEKFKQYIEQHAYFKAWHGQDAILFKPSGLIGDHIKPIALGGSEWGMKNIQTLCFDCNKIKTSEDLILIANKRKIIAFQKEKNKFYQRDYYAKNREKIRKQKNERYRKKHSPEARLNKVLQEARNIY
jgi:5-methylcytosine-specific restriction endonuclease McrA